MQSCIPIEELMLCQVFTPYIIMQLIFVFRKVAIFYLALIHLPKFQRGQGQTSIILLVIKFLKTISYRGL